MKKIMILACVAILALGETSCKKDWDCVCDGTTIGTYPNVKKSTASDACNALEAPGGFDDCSVK